MYALAGQLDGRRVAGDGRQPALQLGPRGDGQAVERSICAGDVADRRTGQGLQVGLGADVELLGQVGRAEAIPWRASTQLAVEVGEDHLGAQDVLLAGLAGLVADAGHLDEVLDQRPVLAAGCVRPVRCTDRS